MIKTHWKQISKIEAIIGTGDPTYLHEFIDLLAKHKLLTEYMLEALCDATHSREDRTKVFDLLHEFAGNKE
ncbi:hypothetical protein LCGC14_2591920 [marine sediment metagenome]|uniref:Uncharacterized protein n=1 Tax=marine sediment metagenome TaxID=412755 RepID=A0A0F9CMH4_9ZZZZ